MVQTFAAALKPYQVSTFTDNSFRFCPAGHRLSVIRWKETTDKVTGVKKPAKSAVCVPVPLVAFEIEPAGLSESVKEFLESQQDLIVRGAIDRWFTENANCMLADILIDPFSLTVEGIARFGANNAIGAKLSVELVRSWFEAYLQEPLELKLAALPEATDAMVEKAVKQHRELLEKLASPKAIMGEDITRQLIKVVGFVEEDTSVKGALLRKLNGFLVKDEELLMAL